MIGRGTGSGRFAFENESIWHLIVLSFINVSFCELCTSVACYYREKLYFCFIIFFHDTSGISGNHSDVTWFLFVMCIWAIKYIFRDSKKNRRIIEKKIKAWWHSVLCNEINFGIEILRNVKFREEENALIIINTRHYIYYTRSNNAFVNSKIKIIVIVGLLYQFYTNFTFFFLLFSCIYSVYSSRVLFLYFDFTFKHR